MPNSTHRRSLMGYILRPVAWQLSLASRLARPSSHKLITSVKSSHCTQPRFIMNFRSPEGLEEVKGWYNYQGRNVRFTQLEYRKHKNGQVKHEFIVVWLNNTTLCRFDRRPQDNEHGQVLLEEGVPAEDSAHILSSFETEYKELIQQTEVLLTIKLPRGEDLRFILAVCEGIQTHAKASVYNLMRYNCYFFSWMIVAAVARRTYNWETDILSQTGWNNILQTSLTRTFSSSYRNEYESESTLPPRTGIRKWFTMIIARPRLRLRGGATSGIDDFQEVLLSKYSGSHGIIRRVPRKLLLRSQLGPSLERELRYIESISSFSTTLDASRLRVESYVYRPGRTIHPTLGRNYMRLINAASQASAAVLSEKERSRKSRGDYWEMAWKTAWEGNGYNRPTNSECEKYMNRWKSAWDEFRRLSDQYLAIITETTMVTMMEQLTDVVPEQLMFGESTRHPSGEDQPEGPPSLQEFIRGRMKDHFEIVDRFGFGSYQELITTAEEAMCEIWVTSLETWESGRFQS
ncbi:unnamed protein product [Rhizoctonia solani]|uniref:Uncharacterized protein n=1 Tax=Rhizoctonia solani TaxID=456999 RepID=A0A8H3CPF0_9AGAM|nr:unnamed protein product [Rhizoctonia solani]